MKSNFTEAAFGIVTLALLGIAIVYLLKVAIGFGSYDGYTVYADFASVKGLQVDDPVEIAGVPIGRVESIHLHGFDARLRLTIKEGVKLRADAFASVANRSILTGTKFIRIEPGTSKDLLGANQRIANTRSAHDLPDLIVGLVSGGLGLKLL